MEPIPENISDMEDGADNTNDGDNAIRTWTPLRVLYAAIKDLPSYQSITSALEELKARNEELAELRQTLSHYESLASRMLSVTPDPTGDSWAGPLLAGGPGGPSLQELAHGPVVMEHLGDLLRAPHLSPPQNRRAR